MAAGAGGNPNLGEISRGQRIQVAAQALYGYGYAAPFLTQLEDVQLDCGASDLDAALAEYAFLTDMNSNYGFLNSYAGSNPYDQLNDVSDPNVLSYYATELNHAMKRGLYCIVKLKSWILFFTFPN